MQKMYMIEATTGDWEDRVDVTVFACFTIEELDAEMEQLKKEAQAFYNQIKYNTYYGLTRMFGIDTTYVFANMVDRGVYNNYLSLQKLSIDVGVVNAPVREGEPVLIEFAPYDERTYPDVDMTDDLPYNKYEELGEAIEAKFR